MDKCIQMYMWQKMPGQLTEKLPAFKWPLHIPGRQRVENAESYYDAMNLEGRGIFFCLCLLKSKDKSCEPFLFFFFFNAAKHFL